MERQKKGLQRLFKSRGFVYGTPSVIIILVVIAIAIFAVSLSDRYVSYQIDATSEKIYSIGEQTKAVLDQLDKEVVIYELADDAMIASESASSGYNRGYIEMAYQLVDDCEKHSDKIRVEKVNPDKNPQIIDAIDPQNVKGLAKFDIVFQCEGKVAKVTPALTGEETDIYLEQTLVGALHQVSMEKSPKMYEITGHSEGSLSSDYFSFRKVAFESYGMTFDSLNILSEGKIPEDASFIIFLAPQNDLSASEAQIVKEYLTAGGRAIFMFDPLKPDRPLDNFNDVLKAYNISVTNSIIYEKDSTKHAAQKEELLFATLEGGPEYEYSQKTVYGLLFDEALRLDILKYQSDKITVDNWMYTSEKAEAVPVKSGGEAQTGLFPLLLTSKLYNDSLDNDSKVAVFADATFATNMYVTASIQPSITKIVGGVIGYFQGESAIKIDPKTYASETVTVNAGVYTFLFWLLVIIIPLLIVGVGVFVWAMRRHR